MAALCEPAAEESPMPVAAVEGVGHVIGYVNPPFCRLVGKSKQELIGSAFAQVVPAGEECLRLLDRVHDTGQAETHIGEDRPTADPFYWSYSMWPLLGPDGTPAAIMIQVTETTPFHQEVTRVNQALMLSTVREHELREAAELLNAQLQGEIAERKHAQEELRTRNAELAESRDFLHYIVDGVAQPLLVLDTEMRIRSANQAFYRCFLSVPETTVGHLLHRLEGGQWHIPEIHALLRKVLENQPFEDVEVQREFQKAGRKILLLSARQLDAVQLILLSINDVTERRKAEAALRSGEDHLRRAQKMEAIGRLAGGVAHDFNNLLTSILGYSELLLESTALDDKRHREHLQVIKNSALRAAELTRQLLTFSRKRVSQSKVLQLDAVIAGMDVMLRRVLGDHIELVVAHVPPRGFIRADPAEIGQIVMNLALNSRDAMVHGGTLTIETRTVEVREPAAAEYVKPGNYVMLAVKDTGVGMDDDTQCHLFEPFFTTKDYALGAGMGLSTVFGIVEQSGGQIRFSSQLGHGTTFRIYFPRVADPAPQAEKQRPPAASMSLAPSGSEIVLLAEDEEAVRILVLSFLQAKGYTVLEAENGADALAICKRQQHIDLLLTDVRMPGMGGRELTEKAAPLHPQMKVILMSGYTDDALIAEGIRMKGIPFLQKPFTLPELAAKVREVLDGKKHVKREH
ncbi:MAG TPA: response regulator [Bryobacteraceae bacterium]|nr:response regulator [Bryobacteraceae bacterium]